MFSASHACSTLMFREAQIKSLQHRQQTIHDCIGSFRLSSNEPKGL